MMDLGTIDQDLEDLKATLENIDNLQRKNNMKIRGLKEKIENDYLLGFLE